MSYKDELFTEYIPYASILSVQPMTCKYNDIPVWFTNKELNMLPTMATDIINNTKTCLFSEKNEFNKISGYITNDESSERKRQLCNVMCNIKIKKPMECPYLFFLTGHAQPKNSNIREESIVVSDTYGVFLPPRPNSCPPSVGGTFSTINIPHSPCDMTDSASPITRLHHDIPAAHEEVCPQSFINNILTITEPISFDGSHWMKKKKKFKPPRFHDRYKRVDWRVDETAVVKFHSELVFNTVQDINWYTTTPIRAGVIVYNRTQNDIRFALGIDIGSTNITDFGGGVKYSEENDAVTAALREFKEETCGVFGQITVSQVGQCKVVVKGTNIMIIFIPLCVDPVNIVHRFEQAQSVATDPELESIIWLDRTEFEYMISYGQHQNHTLYEPVQDLLRDLHTKYNNFIDVL